MHKQIFSKFMFYQSVAGHLQSYRLHLFTDPIQLFYLNISMELYKYVLWTFNAWKKKTVFFFHFKRECLFKKKKKILNLINALKSHSSETTPPFYKVKKSKFKIHRHFK